ncbi:hypothetical protein CEXT_35931 [Caerostris extrusa]|uniref:Uncharacterized protein n=1 Tax=Caerostris extrusa TaxID=172846 RepID=A0AAV4MG57_CAEEX|nr:hypothetical protein CEXT_35931 [Caerostris extrusa]
MLSSFIRWQDSKLNGNYEICMSHTKKRLAPKAKDKNFPCLILKSMGLAWHEAIKINATIPTLPMRTQLKCILHVQRPWAGHDLH